MNSKADNHSAVMDRLSDPPSKELHHWWDTTAFLGLVSLSDSLKNRVGGESLSLELGGAYRVGITVYNGPPVYRVRYVAKFEVYDEECAAYLNQLGIAPKASMNLDGRQYPELVEHGLKLWVEHLLCHITQRELSGNEHQPILETLIDASEGGGWSVTTRHPHRTSRPSKSVRVQPD